MTIEFTKFVGKAPQIEAIQVTAENIEELAVWIGADEYSVSKVLVGGEREVVFNKLVEDPRYTSLHHRTDPIVRVKVGEWLVRHPAAINEYMHQPNEWFRAYPQKDIDNFVKQQHDTGEVDLNKE